MVNDIDNLHSQIKKPHLKFKSSYFFKSQAESGTRIQRKKETETFMVQCIVYICYFWGVDRI